MELDHRKILYFAVFGFAFIALLTVVIRVAKLHVRGRLTYPRALGLTGIFVAVLVGVWAFVTPGPQSEQLVQTLILPNPMDVLRSFAPLHLEQGLLRGQLISRVRLP